MNQNHFDPLDHFLNWYLANQPVCTPHGEIIHNDGQVIETILLRQNQFQVQQCIVLPNSELPNHVHPDVDSFEVYVAGDITFRRGDESYTPTRPMLDCLRILPDCSHGGTIGKRGGVFLSVQQWDTIMPSFISTSWKFSGLDTERNLCLK